MKSARSIRTAAAAGKPASRAQRPAVVPPSISASPMTSAPESPRTMSTSRTWRVVGSGFALASLALGCGSSGSSEPAAGRDASVGDDRSSPEAGSPSVVKLGSVRATVKYLGSETGQLSVGVFRENPPKTKPPVAFDTSKTPTFPYSASLRGIEAGRYWVVAVLDLPPLTPGNVVPGPEDLVGTSEGFDIVGEGSVEVDLSILDPVRDAGVD